MIGVVSINWFGMEMNMMDIIDKQQILMTAVACMVVFFAMMIDLISGLYKAHLRKDARRSEALKRTGYKFCLYEGSMLIACGVDVLIHMSKVALWFGWEMVYSIPLVTLMLGVFWCLVEFLSVREKADDKIHSNIAKAEKIAKQVLTREEWVGILADAMREGMSKQQKDELDEQIHNEEG